MPSDEAERNGKYIALNQNFGCEIAKQYTKASRERKDSGIGEQAAVPINVDKRSESQQYQTDDY